MSLESLVGTFTIKYMQPIEPFDFAIFDSCLEVIKLNSALSFLTGVEDGCSLSR